MNTVSQFLKNLDESNQAKVVEQIKSMRVESLTKEDLAHFVESQSIELFKQKQLLEYLDANRDKLLARVQFNEQDPVRISDDFAPKAGMHGVVMAKGEGNTFRIKFADSELDIPEQHLIRNPAPVEDSKYVEETKLIVLSIDGVLTEAVVQTNDWDEHMISEGMCMDILAIMPSTITEDILNSFRSVAEVQLTESQIAIRDHVMSSAIPVMDKLIEAYGDDWTDILFGAATNHALLEDVDSEEPVSSPENTEKDSNQIFSHTNQEGDTSTITKNGEQFVVNVVDKNGNEIENKTFNDVNHADQLVQNFM